MQLYSVNDYIVIMEQLTQVVTIRLKSDEYEVLHRQAQEQNKPVAWMIRETIRKGLAAN